MEILQRFTDHPLSECPACGSISVQRVMSIPNVRVKCRGVVPTAFPRIEARIRLRAAHRKSAPPDFRHPTIGFRVASSISEE